MLLNDIRGVNKYFVMAMWAPALLLATVPVALEVLRGFKRGASDDKQ